jgi:hypothetical protein
MALEQTGSAGNHVWMQITLELNNNKWPQPDRLKEMWEENERALLEWPMLAVMSGRFWVGPGSAGLQQSAECSCLCCHVIQQHGRL